MNWPQAKKFFRKYILTASLIVPLTAALCGCVAGIDPAYNAMQNPDEGVTVFAAGDIADCRKLQPADTAAAQTARLILAGLAKSPNAAALSLGDNTYPVGLPIEFTNCYQPTWGQFKARTYPTPGNHEYYTPAATGYYGYFGAAAGPAQRGYYSVDIGTWHVISLNSNLRSTEFAAQLAWLKTDLDQHKSHCTMAYWHHPVYSSGGHGNNDFMLPVWRTLIAADADLVLVSHDHDYERFAPQDGNGQRDDARGIRQFVVGTGGAALTPFGPRKPNSEHAHERFPPESRNEQADDARGIRQIVVGTDGTAPIPFGLRKPNSEIGDNSTHGVLKLALKETGYEWEFLPVAPSGFSDRGATLCH